eukprot:scaffold412_cov116-Isochrysis_galbana.AAC.9
MEKTADATRRGFLSLTSFFFRAQRTSLRPRQYECPLSKRKLDIGNYPLHLASEPRTASAYSKDSSGVAAHPINQYIGFCRSIRA